MAQYYINTNKQQNGDYEVHAGSCAWLPSEDNRIYLGIFDNGIQAVTEAKRRWPKPRLTDATIVVKKVTQASICRYLQKLWCMNC